MDYWIYGVGNQDCLIRMFKQTTGMSSQDIQIPPQNSSSVELYRANVEKWLKEHVRVSAIHERLKERGYGGSYASVLRLAQQIDPKTPEAVTRLESQPDEEAQVDFGYVGLMHDADGKLRKTWSFVTPAPTAGAVWCGAFMQPPSLRRIRHRPNHRHLADLPSARAGIL